MDKPADDNLLKQKISDSIKSGRVKMRPRWHFIFQTSLIIAGAIMVLLALLYLSSFTIFSLRQNGAWFVPSFGWRGWYELLFYFPWLLILLLIVFAVILELLAKHYTFIYSRPLFYSILAIIFITVCGGYLIAQTPFHGILSRYLENGRLPLAGGLYRQINRRRYGDIHRGEVFELNQSGLVIKNRRGELLNVSTSSSTSLPASPDFSVGDMIVVFGHEAGRREVEPAVQAWGIIKVEK